MRYEDIIPVGTPVVVRSYTSGVIVGLLHCGERGVVGLTKWRWLRQWANVGGEGSVYDLVKSSRVPTRRGPQTDTLGLFQQADLMVIDTFTYERLYG